MSSGTRSLKSLEAMFIWVQEKYKIPMQNKPGIDKWMFLWGFIIATKKGGRANLIGSLFCFFLSGTMLFLLLFIFTYTQIPSLHLYHESFPQLYSVMLS